MERSLKVRYTEWPPWAMDVPDGNSTKLDGVFKDVFEALSYSLKYKFQIHTQEDHLFGSLQADGNYSGMLGALARKEVDIGGPFVASEQRSVVVDFTNCLEFSRLGIITGIESADRNMFLYFKAFSWEVWLLLLVTVVTCSLVSILIYDVSVNGWKANQGLLLSRYCWFFWSYLIGHDGGTTNHWALKDVWYRHSFRILLAAWLLGPVINSLYTFQGTITSTFAITRLRPVISGLEELSEKKKIVPVITKGSAVEICFRYVNAEGMDIFKLEEISNKDIVNNTRRHCIFFRSHTKTSSKPVVSIPLQTSKDHVHIWDRMQNNSIRFSASTVEDTVLKAEKGTHILIVDYIYALSIVSEWVKRTGRCTVQVEELLFCQNFIALALKKGFEKERMKKINSQLTYIIQAKLTDRWMNRVLKNYTHCTRQPSDGSKPLGIKDILGGFILWAVGIVAAIILLISEIMTFKNQKKKENQKFVTDPPLTINPIPTE